MSDAFKLTGATVAKLAALYRSSIREDTSPDGQDKFIPASEPRYFYATLQTTGPLGTEADYTDARYWFQRVLPSNTGPATDAATFTAASGPYAQIGTATNLAELANGSHNLKSGSLVQIWWEYDATTPRPTVRYLIGQPSPNAVICRIDHKIGDGGLYTGPMLTGNSTLNATEGSSMPNGLTVGTVQCLINNIEESGLTGWRLPVSGTDAPVYAIGTYQGMSTDATPVPVIFIRGALGDLNAPLDLPGMADGLPTYGSPDTTPWDWNANAQAFKFSPVTNIGYSTTPHALFMRTRFITVDARGVIRKVSIEGSGGETFEIPMTAVTVVTQMQLVTAGLQIKTRTIYVPEAGTESDWETIVPACS